MALVWESKDSKNHYAVRSAGNSLRLYTNGIFHTQYNPRQLLTGSVWDLLMLPVFFHCPSATKRVLILGVGGGALFHLLLELTAAKEMVGIDCDPMHLKIAKRFFRLRNPRIQMKCADAREWVDRYQGEPFDLVVDDLYGDHKGEPIRGVAADREWLTMLKKCLSPSGTLVMNYATRDEFKGSAYYSHAAVRRGFRQTFGFTTPHCDNLVVALLKKASSASDLRRQLSLVPRLDPNRADCKLRYRVRRLTI